MGWLELLTKAPSLLSILVTLPRIFNEVKTAISQGFSLNTLENLIKNQVIRDFLTSIGSLIFPSLAPELHASAVLAMSSPDYVLKVQNSLNTLENAGLDPDGHYGPKTRAAILAFQAKYGLKQDEFAGDITMAKIGDLLAKRSVPQQVALTMPTSKAEAATA